MGKEYIDHNFKILDMCFFPSLLEVIQTHDGIGKKKRETKHPDYILCDLTMSGSSLDSLGVCCLVRHFQPVSTGMTIYFPSPKAVLFESLPKVAQKRIIAEKP